MKRASIDALDGSAWLSCFWFLDGEQFARVIVAVAFLLNEDLATLLEQDSPYITKLISDFLSWLKLLVFHLHLLKQVLQQPSLLCVCNCTST